MPASTPAPPVGKPAILVVGDAPGIPDTPPVGGKGCPFYTFDAADHGPSVDLGCARYTKKKNITYMPAGRSIYTTTNVYIEGPL